MALCILLSKMATFLRLGLNLFKNEAKTGIARSISVSPVTRLKEIRETTVGNELVIEGVHVPSPRTPYMVKGPPNQCLLCSTGLDVKHTDVLILSQFLRSDGCMLPRRVTGLCRRQQKKISALVAMAQKAGLMPNLNPDWSHKDPKKRQGYKKFNKYFDESTIKIR